MAIRKLFAEPDPVDGMAGEIVDRLFPDVAASGREALEDLLERGLGAWLPTHH